MKGCFLVRGMFGALFLASLAACQMQPVEVEEDFLEMQVGRCDANLRVKLNTDPTFLDGIDLSCPGACFDVTADKNITHIFVDVGGARDFDVYIDGEEVDPDTFHDRGGPCNHGKREIERDVWFPLTGNQKRAEVCVVIHDGASSKEIKVGAKSACECKDADVEVECEPSHPPTRPPIHPPIRPPIRPPIIP